MALGASTGSVLRLVHTQGVALAGLGLALGLVVSAAGTRFFNKIWRKRSESPETSAGRLSSCLAEFADFHR
jgi:hypothetical protein